MLHEPLIIYIEDNLDNQRLVQRVLTSRGYRLLLAEDGPAGLALAREHTPDLLLVDLGIDGLDGYETTTRLRGMSHLAHTPIVALTANNTSDSRARALVAGCDGFLSKPIDARRLTDQLAEFIAGKRELLPVAMETPLLRAYNQKLVERLEQQVRELTTANAELHESDRLKSQFLASLSHELRTPLTSISGFVDLLARGTLGELNPGQRECVDVMARNVETLSNQINNLLYLQEVRSTQLRREPVALDSLLRCLEDAVRPLAKRAEVHLVIRGIDTPQPPVDADRSALELALRHLLDNAIKFTPAGGHVLLELRNEPTRALVRVGDTGIGIPPEALERIFLPFYQVENPLTTPYIGSGLGLAIAHHIIEAHGGHITVRSAMGKGSIFMVILPRTTKNEG